jgi:hypothetical protein
MWFARDVRDKIKEKIVSDMSTMLGTIDTERSTTTPKPVRISAEDSEKQLPEIVVMLGDSNFSQNMGTYKTTAETMNVRITCFVIGNTCEDAANYAENYIEALLRIFQGYHDDTSDAQNYSMQVRRVLRDAVYTENSQPRKDIAVEFDVMRNKNL